MTGDGPRDPHVRDGTQRPAVETPDVALRDAVAGLATLSRVEDVLAAAVRMAPAHVAPAAEGARAVYFGIEGEIALVLAEHDPSGMTGPAFVWLSDHRALAEVVRTGRPSRVRFSEVGLSGSAKAGAERLQLTHGAAVPVYVGGTLHGVLAVGRRGREITGIEGLVALADAMQVALARVLGHPAA